MKISHKILFFCLLFASCDHYDPYSGTHPTPPEEYIQPIEPDLSAHFNFQTGSYWIYRDSINGRLDSFNVEINFQNQGRNFTNYLSDITNLSIRELNIDHTAVSDSTHWSWCLYGKFIYFNGIYTSFGNLLSYPFRLGIDGVTKIDTTYTLNGNTFSRVAHITHQPDKFYVNDSVGIIKMTLFGADSTTPAHVWELKRWHILK